MDCIIDHKLKCINMQQKCFMLWQCVSSTLRGKYYHEEANKHEKWSRWRKCMKVYEETGRSLCHSTVIHPPKVIMQVCSLKNDGMTVGKAHRKLLGLPRHTLTVKMHSFLNISQTKMHSYSWLLFVFSSIVSTTESTSFSWIFLIDYGAGYTLLQAVINLGASWCNFWFTNNSFGR